VLFPGLILIEHFFGLRNPEQIATILPLLAFGSLLLAIFTGFARDSQRRSETQGGDF